MRQAKKLLALFLLSTVSQAEVLTYGILGDAGLWNESTASVRQSMIEGRITQLILPGDNLYRGSYKKVWSNWHGFKIPIVAIGNHYATYEEEVAFFRLPGEYYAVRPHRDVLFLVLNSDNEATVKEQMAWLYQQLQKATAKQIFLVYHHPSYTVSPAHNWKEKEEFQLYMRQIHKKFAGKITAILAGHDHMNSMVMLDNLPMIVSGASWEWHKIPKVNYIAENKTHVRTAWMFKGGPHWTRLDIDTDKGLVWVNFVRAHPSKVVCSILISGSQFKMRDNCKM